MRSSKVDYLGKTWRVIETLPQGSIVLQRWMWKRQGLLVWFGRGIVITSPNSVVVWHNITLQDLSKPTNQKDEG